MATSGVRFGKYLLEQRLGAGGMAEVWRAVLDEPGSERRTVVVKRVLPHLQAEPRFLEMFLVEARLSARLHHPNVVEIFELGETDGRYYLAMELIEGRDLGSVQRRLGGAMPAGGAAFVMAEVCRALAYAHTLTDEKGEPLGLVHRDVTPQNVMLGRDGAVKLVDFGVAKALRDSLVEHTRTGLVKGKAGYIAPEYLRGEGLDARSDLFGAGVVLHEALTGQRLFWGESEQLLLARMRNPSAFPPSQANPEVTPELDAICARALASDPDARFADARAMAAALDEAAGRLGFGRAELVALMAKVAGPKVEAAPGPRTETLPRPGEPKEVTAEAARGAEGRGGAGGPALAMAGSDGDVTRVTGAGEVTREMAGRSAVTRAMVASDGAKASRARTDSDEEVTRAMAGGDAEEVTRARAGSAANELTRGMDGAEEVTRAMGDAAEVTRATAPSGSAAEVTRAMQAVVDPRPAATVTMPTVGAVSRRAPQRRTAAKMPRWFLWLMVGLVPLAALVAWWLAGGAADPPAATHATVPEQSAEEPLDAAAQAPEARRIRPAPIELPPPPPPPIDQPPAPPLNPLAPAGPSPYPTVLHGPFRPKPGAVLRNLPPRPMHRPLRIGGATIVDPLK